MTSNLQKKLFERYPKIFPKDSDAHQIGIDCGDGWYSIIDDLCSKIQAYVDANPSKKQVVALDVKQKFGMLAFYFSNGNDEILQMVFAAERTSGHICELCGSTKNARLSSKKGWVKTFCDPCRLIEGYEIADIETAEIPQ